jgi:hypothetical protein
MEENPGKRWRKRLRWRRNSIELCQGWKAKVVHHMNQKFAVKKCSPKQSLIRLLSRRPSEVALPLSRSSRSRSGETQRADVDDLPSAADET